MKLPFSFDFRFVFRLLLPGFISSLGLLPIIQPIASHPVLSNMVSVESIFFVTVLIMGWLFIVLDMHIYMFFEGRRYWPSFLKKPRVRSQEKRLEKIKRRLKETNDELERAELHQKRRCFPINKEKGDYHTPYPTRLGNLITSYEIYPKERYGMDSVFYWYRIWLSLDKDVREEIDGKQALVDSTIYVSASCILLSLLFFVYGIVKLCDTKLIVTSLSAGNFFFLSLISLACSYLMYLSSLELHIAYGETFKAMFDMHREEVNKVVDGIAKEIGKITGSEIDDKTWKEKYNIVWSYLQYYRVKNEKDEFVFPWELENSQIAKSPNNCLD